HNPASAQPTPAMINPIVTAGPALFAAAAAVRTNKPAPMIAPIPSATRLVAFSVRFNPFSESSTSRIKRLNGFFTKRDLDIDGILEVGCWKEELLYCYIAKLLYCYIAKLLYCPEGMPSALN